MTDLQFITPESELVEKNPSDQHVRHLKLVLEAGLAPCEMSGGFPGFTRMGMG